MNLYKLFASFLLWALISAAPISVYANYFTLPVDGANITSWFDHDTTSSSMTKYTGENFTGDQAATGMCNDGCYDGHNGIDFATTTGADILAPADGEVEDIWFNTCGGWQEHIWHSEIGLSTLYSHLSATTTEASISRGDKVGEVGSTGSCTSGAHLHFGVTNGYATSTNNRIDPFGWWDTENEDPWAYNRGYLWTTYPPSLNMYTTFSSTMSASTTWRGNYVVNGDVTISSTNNVTLDIEPGTIVKFDGNYGFDVEGSLNVKGATTSPVYFTSFKDDSVGGDWNNNSTSTNPSMGDWSKIKVFSGKNASFDHAILKYGGSNFTSNIYNNGGNLNFYHSTSTLSACCGIQMTSGTSTIAHSYLNNNEYYGYYLNSGSGTTTIASSTISGHSDYGILVGNSGNGIINVTSSTFSDNTKDGRFIMYNGLTLTHSGNTKSGTSPGYFEWGGVIPRNQTIGPDGIIDVINDENMTINSGVTLTVNPGTIIKLKDTSVRVDVNGTLDSEGSTSSPVYFTSFHDDTVGGDTNDNGSVTTPGGANSWVHIKVNSGGTANFEHTVLKYGGYPYGWGIGSSANLFNSGGVIDFLHSTSTLASNHGSRYGIRSNSGTTTVTYSDLSDQGYGIYFTGGLLFPHFNNIHDNSSYGINNATGSSLDAENNYWGNSSGPYHPSLNPTGTGNEVSNNIDFNPWLSNWP